MKRNLLFRVFLTLAILMTISQGHLFASRYFIDNSVASSAIIQNIAAANLDKNTLQFFSHGRPGSLLIDGKWYSEKQLANKIKSRISNDIYHINIYGCEFAKGEVGRSAVKQLEEYLGITISASDDITGKDGDWDLEVGVKKNVLSIPAYDANLQTGPSDDFDGDGVINANDLDDDNDGVLDYTENGGGQAFSSGTVSPSTSGNIYSDGVKGYFINGNAKADFLATPKNNGNWRKDFTTTEGYVFWAALAGEKIIADIKVDPTPYSGSILYEVRYGYLDYPHPIDAVRDVLHPVTTTLTWDNPDFIAIIHDPLDQLSQADLATVTDNTNGVQITLKTTLTNHAERYYVSFVSAKGSQNALNISTSLNPASVGNEWEHTGITAFLGYNDYNSDNSGGTNAFDTDSDNDGCSDAYESGVSGSSPASYTVSGDDSNKNGLKDNLEVAGFPLTASYPPTYKNALDASNSCGDYDQDGVADMVDLDDDNDGITDTDEAGLDGSCATDATKATITFTDVVITDMHVNATVNLNGKAIGKIDQIAVGPDVAVDPNGSRNRDTRTVDATEEATSSAMINNCSMTKGDMWVSTFTPLPGIKFKGTLEYLVPPRANGSFDYGLSQATPFFGTDRDGQSYTAEFVEASGTADHSDGTNGSTVESGKFVSIKNTGVSNSIYIGWKVAVTADSDHPYVFKLGVGTTHNGEVLATNFEFVTCSSIVDYNVDTDGDGLPNRLDLDSDGDGCPDAIEGGAIFTKSDLVDSTLPGGNTGDNYNGTYQNTVVTNLGNTVGNTSATMGIPTIAGTGQGIGTSQSLSEQDAQCAGTLPVTLSSLTAKNNSEGISLEWTTSEEKNFDHFEVQRSSDPLHRFAILGTVNGGGFEYNYLDSDPLSGNNYYRLKMVDTDGSFEYSRVVVAKTEIKGRNFVIFPMPAKDGKFYLKKESDSKDFKLFNTSGKPIKIKVTEDYDRYEFNTSSIIPGLYTLEFNNNNVVVRKKIIIE